ncbi:hypothetical protein PoB_001707000 [Plakobranchus ocellatus]|uniref:Uncharacterized protein n=1 Tax=Plakobranchus ocellatus TaxID=259542 RepID=A0AAV3Z7M4_9GAST|nr:hypothetical protein PoB_001707000 [Plakobranchus ocellatus]
MNEQCICRLKKTREDSCQCLKSNTFLENSHGEKINGDFPQTSYSPTYTGSRVKYTFSKLESSITPISSENETHDIRRACLKTQVVNSRDHLLVYSPRLILSELSSSRTNGNWNCNANSERQNRSTEVGQSMKGEKYNFLR